MKIINLIKKSFFDKYLSEFVADTKIKKMQILWGLALYFLITCIGTE